MKVFDISNGRVFPKAEALLIPEFNMIWSRDKSKDKSRAIKELTYVVFVNEEGIKNPYRVYNYEERPSHIKHDIMPKGWREDKVVKSAMTKYKELSDTSSTRLLRSARYAADKLTQYYMSVDFNELLPNGRPKYSPKELSQNLKDVGGIIKSLDMLEEYVRKEQTKSSVRGGGDIGYYEIPRGDVEYGS